MAISEKKYRYAGVSVTNQADGKQTLKFHTSKLKQLIAVWLEVPGSAFYEYVKLPKLSNKYEAACYLRKHENFQSPAFMRDFINSVCDKYKPNSKSSNDDDDENIPIKKSGTGNKNVDATWEYRKRPNNGRRHKKILPP